MSKLIARAPITPVESSAAATAALGFQNVMAIKAVIAKAVQS